VSKRILNGSFIIGLIAGIFLSGIALMLVNNFQNYQLLDKSVPPDQIVNKPTIATIPENCSNSSLNPELQTFQPTDRTNKGKIDINSASTVELETLPGIGPEKANAIVQFRSDYGLFLSIDELDFVPGISASMIEQMRPLVTVCPAH
jgi:comEA protein